MAAAPNINPNYETIGKQFTQQYYAMFDDPNQRANLQQLYNVSRIMTTGLHEACCSAALPLRWARIKGHYR